MRHVLGSNASIGGVLGSGRGGAAAAANGLLTGLVAYWGLDEASGNALDKHSGGLTLTQVNSPGADTGIVYGTARTFNGSQYFSRAYDGTFNPGAAQFAIATWVYAGNTTGNRGIIDKRGNAPGSGTAGFYGYLLYTNNSTNAVTFVCYADLNGTLTASAATSTIGTAAWHLITAWREGGTVSICLDNGTPANGTGTLGTGSIDSGAPFVVGYKSPSLLTSVTYHNGRIGPMAFWKNRTLSADDRAALWAGGAGLAYSAFS